MASSGFDRYTGNGHDTRNEVRYLFRNSADDEIDEIRAEHTSVTGSIDVKTPRVDIRIVTANKVVDLEAQCYEDDEDQRSLFYGAILLVESTAAGTPYNAIPSVIVMSLVTDEIRFPQNDDFVSACHLDWKTPDGTLLEDGAPQLKFVHVELRKARERYTELDEDVLGDEAVA